MFRRVDRSIVRAAAVFLSASALAGTASVSARENQAPPTGRAVVDRFVQAIGGEMAFRAISSMHAKGMFEMPAQGIKGTIEVFSSRPSNVRLRADIDGVGRIERGYDGKVGWSLNPVEGPSLITGRQLRELLDDGLFDGPLHPAAKVSELTTVEQTVFDGQPAYKVKVVFTSGTEQFEYFAVDSGLLIGSEGSREMPGGGLVPRVNIMRDYKQFGTLKQPTTLVQQTLGLEQVVTITTYEYDSLEPDVFTPPAEIQALIKGR
jgi:hypothetical protein